MVQDTKTGRVRERNPNWRGGRVVEPHGYVLLRRPDHPNADCRGYVYEHIAVMTDHLGRALAPGEEVHHDNEVKDDNRIENLILCATKADHIALHRSPMCPHGHAESAGSVEHKGEWRERDEDPMGDLHVQPVVGLHARRRPGV